MNFNEKAKMWDQDPKKLERTSKIANAIIEHLHGKRELKALEFGAGTGSLSFLLKDYCSSVTLIDTSEGMLEVLKEKIESSNTKNFYPSLFDLEHNDLDDKFDLIYTAMTMHHIKNIPLILNKFASMLNSGGLLCIADIKPEDGSFHPEGMEGIHHKGIDMSIYDTELENNLIYKINEQIVYIDRKNHNGIEKEYEIFLYVAEKR